MTTITRSRFGCSTCRKRKVKCDETLPSCKRCIATGRPCDGPAKTKFQFVDVNPSISKKTQPKQLTASLSLHNFEADEARAFDYFLACAAPCLAATQDSAFWMSLVPRIVQHDLASRHAVFAISTFFEHPRQLGSPAQGERTLAQTHPQALRWHSRSIREFNDNLQLKSSRERVDLALLSCVLLTTIEFQQHHLQNALVLLKYGTDMAAISSPAMSTDAAKVIKGILVPILARQAVMTAASGRVPSQESFAHFNCTVTTPVSAIESLIDARVGLFDCLHRAIDFIQAASLHVSAAAELDAVRHSALVKQKATVMQQLAAWDKEFFVFVHAMKKKTAFEHLTITTMIMYFNIVYIWASTCFICQGDTLSDPNLLYSRFKRIVQCAEVLLQPEPGVLNPTPPTPFSFQDGVAPALLFVKSRCSDGDVQKKALKLLSQESELFALRQVEQHADALEQTLHGNGACDDDPPVAGYLVAGSMVGVFDR